MAALLLATAGADAHNVGSPSRRQRAFRERRETPNTALEEPCRHDATF
jgi:hypothetical protein